VWRPPRSCRLELPNLPGSRDVRNARRVQAVVSSAPAERSALLVGETDRFHVTFVSPERVHRAVHGHVVHHEEVPGPHLQDALAQPGELLLPPSPRDDLRRAHVTPQPPVAHSWGSSATAVARGERTASSASMARK
jgi:hypothetical protein